MLLATPKGLVTMASQGELANPCPFRTPSVPDAAAFLGLAWPPLRTLSNERNRDKDNSYQNEQTN